jgi:hypothetical protein
MALTVVAFVFAEDEWRVLYARTICRSIHDKELKGGSVSPSAPELRKYSRDRFPSYDAMNSTTIHELQLATLGTKTGTTKELRHAACHGCCCCCFVCLDGCC